MNQVPRIVPARALILGLGLVLALFTAAVWAGTTGKITGVVTDRVTGEPIAGALVTVVGTRSEEHTSELQSPISRMPSSA